MVKAPFRFFKPGRLIDGDLELVLVRRVLAAPTKRYLPGYEFEMRHPGKVVAMGTIRLRIGSALAVRYFGHIGYDVKQSFRGHRYAARSCRLLLPLARTHGLTAVWLTVDPKNIASQRTCEIAGAEWVETVRIPKTSPMYAEGARYRRRYRVDLRGVPSHSLGQPRAGARVGQTRR